MGEENSITFNILFKRHKRLEEKCADLESELKALRESMCDNCGSKAKAKAAKTKETKETTATASHIKETKSSLADNRDKCESYDHNPRAQWNLSSNNLRGKKRKNLPGYTCDSCESFWKASGLGPDGIQKCTRHRGTPRPPTPPGWWEVGWTSPSKKQEDDKQHE